MKRLFTFLLLGLVAASVFTWWFRPFGHGEIPSLYWVTTNSPIREYQLRSFQEWLAKNGYDPIDLRIDTSNNDPSKKLIQGISGVGGDLFDNYANQTFLMQSTGILADLTEPAQRHGFGPGSTFEAVRENFMIDGRQWGYPMSTSVALLLVNAAAFEAAGMGVPPRTWDMETFEQWGKRYVEARNVPGERRRYFFASDVERYEIFRSTGLSMYNETLTACCLNDPRYIKVLKKLYQWTHVDHLLPGKAEESTFAVEGSGLGITTALFARGNYAMVNLGRFALVRLRNYEPQSYSASFFPHFSYPNSRVAGGTVGLYTNSGSKEQAYRFFEYLASDAHNQMIVDFGDALPVNPKFLRTESFLRPLKYPNEWGVHEVYAEAMETYAIARSRSPFLLPEIGRRLERDLYNVFMAGRMTAEETAAEVEKRLNAEIERSLRERPSLRVEYERRLKLQEQIDKLKAAGKPIPEDLIYNPFHRKYYRDMGIVEGGVKK